MGAGYIPKKDIDGDGLQKNAPFAAKVLIVNGVVKKLYKRVHGITQLVPTGQTVNIDLVVPYAWCKFTGAEIFNTEFKDSVNFSVHDTANNDISGLDAGTYGANFMLNQFGFNVIMPESEYRNTSDYDADLYQNMIIRCSYTNNGQSDKTIGMNVWLHEVKD